MCENYIDEIGVGWYNVKYLKLFAKESKFMKKTRILALVIAILSLATLLFLVSCKNDSGKNGNCSVTGEHKWSDWKSKGDATCTEDGTRTRKCPVCKKEESEVDPDTATGHYFLPNEYQLNDDATCTTDGTETAKCYLCTVATDTRVAVDSALGHRFGNNPVADESHNGYNVFVCLRSGCGHRETFDNGTIDEDFEYVDTIEDNSKRYFTPGAVTEIVAYAEGEGKYLMLKRSAEKVVGDSAFGIYLTPDYDLYKSKDYVVSYDIMITENTRDLVLLAGKKARTEQIFASYDYESKSIVVNGNAVYTLTDAQFNTFINLAFVLDDANGEIDLYVDNSLYASKAIYDKKDTYYHASELEYLCIRMVAEPKIVSEFGIDNIKTYVGKTVTNPLAPSVSENVTSTVSIPTNIMGDIDMAWIEEFRNNLKAIGGNYTDAKFESSFAYEAIDKNGKSTNVMTWQNFNSGIPYFNIYDFKGLEKHTLTEANAGGVNYDFTGGKTYEVYDLSVYESITINFYCDMTSEELAAMGRDGYQILVAFYTPNAWRSDKNAYWSTYTHTYYTFTAEDVLNGEDGWQSVTIPLSKFNQNHIKNVAYFTLTAKGWGSDGVGVGLPDGSNNNNNAVDGTVIKVQSITLDKPGTIIHAKLDAECEHEFTESRTIEASCYTPGYTVNKCAICKGEQADMETFVAALGHNYVTIQNVASTCTEKGYYSEKCLNCNDKIRYDIPATGHSESTAAGYEPTVIAPTCYSTGVTIRTCGVCNGTFETDVTSKVDHTWDEGVITAPSCTEEGVTTFTCINNGADGCDGVKTEAIAALGHEANPEQNGEYVPATCEKGGYTPSKCIRCEFGMEVANSSDKKLGHEWVYDSENEKNVPATCYAAGTDYYTCSRCTKTKSETVAATGNHNVDYEGVMVIVTAPTCTAKGEGGYGCVNEGCNYIDVQELEMIEHTEDTTVEAVVTAPGCGVDGYTTRTCSACGQKYQTDVVPGEEHDDGGFAHIIQEHACDKDGFEKYTCIKCTAEVFVSFEASLGGHKYETVIDDVDKALRSTCTVCGVKVDPTVSKLPAFADMIAALGTNGVKVYTYLDLDKYADGTESTGGTGVVTGMNFCLRKTTVFIRDNGGVDNVGKYVQFNNKPEKLADSHTYLSTFPANEKGGKIVFEVALRLGKPGTDGKYAEWTSDLLDNDSAANNPVNGRLTLTFMKMDGDGVVFFPANDFKVQLTETNFTHFAIAFDISANTMDIYVDGVLTAQDKKMTTAAETQDMSKYQFDEMRMFQFFANNTVGLGSWVDIANMIVYDGDMPYAVTGVNYCAIKGTEHEEDAEAVQVIAPTCTERGYTVHTCANCGGTWVDSYVDATGHTEYEIGEEYAPQVVAPTCFAKGYTKRQCVTCEEFYNTDETEMVPHTMSTEATDYVDPTCTEAGYYVFTCTVEGCGHTEREEVEATGHSAESTVIRVVEPTCTAGGYTVMNCPDCGINYKADEVPANGHVYGEFIKDYDPTCTETGKETKYCENCIWTVSQVIPATGHTWEQTGEIAATCYADGSKSFACKVCAETKTDAVTERPAHTWGEEEEAVAATCTTTGKMVKYCTVEECGAFSDRVTSKLGHKLEKDGQVTTEPTCTELGVLTKRCEREGCDYVEEFDVAALGHKLVIDPEKNTYTCTQDGVQAYKCTECDYTEATPMAATGHSFTGTEVYTFLEPTCYADGIKTRKCANCDALMHEEGTEGEKATCVIKTTVPHNMVAGQVIAPTETTDGYTIYNCSNDGCTHTENRDVVPAIATGTEGFLFAEVDGGYYITGYEGTDTDIIIPATYKGLPVIGIDPSVFAYDAAGITSITIESDNIFSGGDYGMFGGCNLEYVILGADVTYVPVGTFEMATIGTLYIEGDAYVEDVDFEMVAIGKTVYGPKED